MPAFKALLTADAGFNIEDYLIKNNVNIAADILKVGHHGSKYSSSEEFLKAVNPKVAVVEVGAKNTYGHPAEEALSRIASIAAKIFRTDQNGTIEVLADSQKLKVYAEK
jgi:competence protein ComEC